MDEAGGYANTQLICSVEAIFSLLPAPDPQLRTLTLGVLIVSGGMLAALPFRRYQAIPDASSAPAQVTGPMQSVLESHQPAALAIIDRSGSGTAETNCGDFLLATPLDRTGGHRQNVALDRSPRRANIPLTFEDLQMPIAQPDLIKERFNATAPIRAERLDQERMAELVMPALESLAIEQVEQIQQAATRFAEASRPKAKVAGSLASSQQQHLDPLPKTDSSERPRHWIRQPD